MNLIKFKSSNNRLEPKQAMLTHHDHACGNSSDLGLGHDWAASLIWRRLRIRNAALVQMRLGELKFQQPTLSTRMFHSQSHDG